MVIRTRAVSSAVVYLLMVGSSAFGQTGVFNAVSVGTPPPNPPGESVRVEQGNILLNSTGEQGVMFRRFDGSYAFGPKFTIGRVGAGGDGATNFWIFYSDDATPSGRKVVALDREGIVASVRRSPGSHFEGFLQDGDTEPVFRLNSAPDMQLELGPGGNSPTDVFIRRCGAKCVRFPQAAVEAASFSAGDLRIRAAMADVQPLSDAEAIGAFEQLHALKTLDQNASTSARFTIATQATGGFAAETNAVEVIALLTQIVRLQERRIAALEERLLTPGPNK